MSNSAHHHTPCPEKDGQQDELEQLLSQDAQSYPVQGSPWFATRTAALAREIPQQGRGSLLTTVSRQLRWLLPIPLAGLTALVLLLMQQHPLPSHSRTFSSSESEFEQNIEMIASSDTTQDYFVSQ